jgi:vacuolar-type H+-ATPase subunit I/STV1
MKKVTIISPPEYESLILESLGSAGVTQLKEVTGPDFDALRGEGLKGIDYGGLYQKIHSRYQELAEMGGLTPKQAKPDVEDLRRFVAAPNDEVNAVLGELDGLIARFKEVKEAQNGEVKSTVDELQRSIEERNAAFAREKSRIEGEKGKLEAGKKQQEAAITAKYEGAKARLESVRALEPEQLKSCFAAGVAKNDVVARLEEYLKRNPDVFTKAVGISPDESMLFIFGSEASRKWVEALFLVFEVKDIFDVLNTRDILLVLDPARRNEVIQGYQEELRRLEEEQAQQAEKGKALESKFGEFDREIDRLQEENKQALDTLKQQYDGRLKELEAKHAKELDALRGQQLQALNKVAYMDSFLGVLSDTRAPVLRTKVISVLQGWIPDHKVPTLEKSVADVEAQTGEKLFLQFEDPSHEDQNVPTPPPDIKPSILQPAWTLTTLRGWPSVHEMNPAYISIIFFAFQFGLMFGDIGQGAIILALGIFLTRKYKRGMMSKLGTLFLPMGISAIVFGFLYNSFFLIEEFLPFHAVMPNPVERTTRLMLLVFQIAVVEMIAGLSLGAINELKSGHKWGALGEHGLGMILYIVGLYLSAYAFIADRSSPVYQNFMGVLSYWTFYIMLSGLVLSMVEPIIASISHGHFGMEVFGQGIGGLLMTFVEGLANLFSFLRIAAFALAHASLALAAKTMSTGILGVGGLVIMNVIAMTFELISSSVQSLRLLYYEFMGKFFHGEGVPFRPFTIRNR